MKRRLLVVDDSPLVRNLVKKALTGMEEFEIVGEASNGKEAIEKCEELSPDIITLDVTMPVMDGYEAAKVIKQKKPNVKILLMSAMGDEDLLNQFKALGVTHSLQKPFKNDALIQKLKEVSQ